MKNLIILENELMKVIKIKNHDKKINVLKQSIYLNIGMLQKLITFKKLVQDLFFLVT